VRGKPARRSLQQHGGQKTGGHAGELVFALEQLVPDLAQHAAQPIAAAGELHRAGIGQQLALARDTAACKSWPAIQPSRPAATKTGPTSTPKAERRSGLVGLEQRQAVAMHQRQAPHQREQLHVEPQVALVDVAELVGHQALQLVAGQALQAPARHRHHRGRRATSRPRRR
jgi:hypothetical protein